MLPEIANAPNPDRPPDSVLLSAYADHLAVTGRGNVLYERAARRFLLRWADSQAWADQPLADRVATDSSTRPFVMFLIVWGWLRPGWDWLVSRKLSTFWRDIVATPLEADMARFLDTAEAVGFTPIQAKRAASQSVGRLLIQTGRPLDGLTVEDLDDLAAACRLREETDGQGWRHYRAAIVTAHTVLFHLGVVDEPPPAASQPQSLSDRVGDVSAVLRPDFVAYLERKAATCVPKTVSSLATRLAHFGRFLAAVDPNLQSLRELDRRRHIEPYLNSVAETVSPKTGQPITVADQSRRILAVSNFLSDITEWGWEQAPLRRLVFPSDIPRLPRPLPRYIPVDADRRLTDVLEASSYRLAADGLLLARATGLRIGELLDLELDCVHEIEGHGSWLKVPLGKLDTERMVPLDDETLELVDRIAATRTPGRPLPHPRTGRPTQFLFTHHGRRLSQTALRKELSRAADQAGIGHVTPHQLRHTYATALVNAGVSLQALMALLGHVSAQMSLRYAHLFDSTVRTEYERALNLAKTRLGSMPIGPSRIPVSAVGECGDGDEDWKDAPAIKARLAGGYCLRAPAQGACPYANICEHCPNFRADAASVTVLAAQRLDTQALAEDAQARGWIQEAERHQQLLDRLDNLIAQATA